MLRYYIMLLVALACTGCSEAKLSAPPTPFTDSSTSTFEGKWVTDLPEMELFIGGTRWLLFKRQPERFVVEGTLQIDKDQDQMASTLDVTISSAGAQYEKHDALIKSYSGTKLLLIRDGNTLRVVTGNTDCELSGVYHYNSDASPAKGFDNVHDWGTN